MIRRADVADAPIVAALAVQMWDSATEDDLAAEFEALLCNDDAVVFLCSVDGEDIGFAQCQLRHDYVEGTDSSPVGYLEGVFVREDHRGHGWGRKLTNACEQWAKDCGCEEFASDCELNNTPSLVFHLRCGFKEANRVICFTKKI